MEGKDLTKGNLLKNMIILFIPLLLTNLLNSIYIIVDGIYIGNLIGKDGVSAITNCYPITLIATSISTSMAVATSVLVSQYYGAKQKEKVKYIMGVSYSISTAIAILVSAILILTSSFWLKILNTPQEIFEVTKQYLTIYLIGFIFNYLFTVMMEELRAIGNSRVPLIFVCISTVINLVLDPILINIGLGVQGTALATLIAMFVDATLAIIYLDKKSDLLKIDFKYIIPKKEYVKQIFKIGIPITLQELFVSTIVLIEVNVSNDMGVIGSASFGIGQKLEQVVVIIGRSFTTMATVAVGQFIGKNMIQESTKVTKEGLKLMLLPTIAITLISYVFTRRFCKIFVQSEDVIFMASQYLYAVGIAYVLIPFRRIISGFISGTGHTKYISFTTMMSCITEAVSILILTKITNLESLVVLGLALTFYAIVETILNTSYYISKKWQTKVIKE